MIISIRTTSLSQAHRSSWEQRHHFEATNQRSESDEINIFFSHQNHTLCHCQQTKCIRILMIIVKYQTTVKRLKKNDKETDNDEATVS